MRLLAVGPRPARRSGRRSRRPARWRGSCPSGSGSGCCRTPRRSTGSPSTGTSSRPASRRRALIRRSPAPDVLMVAALLHDIGKGGLTEHSVAGEPIAREHRDPDGLRRRRRSSWSRTLVRWHLLLAETATTRDPDDPATVELRRRAARRPPRRSTCSTALTEADARATSPKAWSTWRAGLIRDLAAPRPGRARPAAAAAAAGAADEVEVPRRVRRERRVSVDRRAGRRRRPGSPSIAPDRVGLLADVAALFALQRASVRAARAWAQDEYGVSVWEVAEEHLDAGRAAPALRRDRRRPASTRPPGCGRPRRRALAPTRRRAARGVARRRRCSRCGPPTGPGVRLPGLRGAGRPRRRRSAPPTSTRSGPQAVDVFYVQEAGAGALSERPGRRGRARRPRGARPGRRDGLHGRRHPVTARLDALGHDRPPPPRNSHLFATLSDRLADTFKNLRGKGRLSEADIDATAREIRIALLEADVALPVVKEFVAAVKERARGEEVSEALNPAQQIVKIVNEELVDDPRRRDPPAALRQDRPDRDHARRPPGRRQDHAGRQARALAQGAGQDARCWSPPTSSAPTPSTSSRSTASGSAYPSSRPSPATASATRSRSPAPRSRRPSARSTTSSSSTPPAASASTPS